MFLQDIIDTVFDDLSAALMALDNITYSTPATHLSGSTIGQHTRHIIELFQCLITGYDTHVVNYEKRKRDMRIETNKTLAVFLMRQIAAGLDKENKALSMEAAFGSSKELVVIDTNYYRELAYNLEHTIHHMALIRVGIQQLTDIALSETFGVAPSTVQYRKACVQ